MARDPAFLFYPNDYLGGTMGFSFEQHGMYLMLLIYQFNQGDFDYDKAQSLCQNKFDTIKNKFSYDETSGKYFNSRLKEEIGKREKYSQSRRDNIAKRYEKATHVEHVNNTCSTHVVHMENENRNEDTNEIEIKKEIIKRKQFIIPTVEEIDEYCKERNNGINAQDFFDHYEARDWKPKGYTVRMVSWKAVVRTWEKNNFGGNKNGANQGNSKRVRLDFEKNIESKYAGM